MTVPIYLDNAASTPVAPEVQAAIVAAWRDGYANPSAQHPGGAVGRALLAEARATISAALGDPGATLGHIVFTSGCTEADALGTIGVVRARAAGRPSIAITTRGEHAAVAATLAAEPHLVSHALPIDTDGWTCPSGVADAPADATLAALIWVQNEIGVVQPIAALARALRARGTGHIHVDAAQAIGKIEVDLATLDIDSLAIAGHKLGTPKGIGALWLRHGAAIQPLWHGGGHQGGLRAGSEDPGMACGLATAIQRATEQRPAFTGRAAGWVDILLAALGTAGVAHRVLGGSRARAPHILALALPGVPAGALRQVLASRGVYVSTGAACADRNQKPSPLLVAMGVAPEDGVVRLSFGEATTDADVTRAARLIAQAASELRRVATSETS